MARLYDRAFELIIEDRKLSGLDIEFQIERSLDASQNTAEILVYNLSADTRKHLQAKKTGVVVQLKAGYQGENPLTPSAGAALTEIGIEGEGPPLIFLGRLREINHTREGADWVTRLSAGDGDDKKKAHLGFSMGPGVDYGSVIQKVLDSMGAQITSASKSILKGKFKEVGNIFSQGVAVHGNAHNELRKLLDSGGLEHSYQNGEVQILPKGQPLNTNAIRLAPNTGLIGSPELSSKGLVRCRSLLNAQIYPGRKIQIASDSVSGYYRVEKATYSGQSANTDWYVDVEGKAL